MTEGAFDTVERGDVLGGHGLMLLNPVPHRLQPLAGALEESLVVEQVVDAAQGLADRRGDRGTLGWTEETHSSTASFPLSSFFFGSAMTRNGADGCPLTVANSMTSIATPFAISFVPSMRSTPALT